MGIASAAAMPNRGCPTACPRLCCLCAVVRRRRDSLLGCRSGKIRSPSERMPWLMVDTVLRARSPIARLSFVAEASVLTSGSGRERALGGCALG